jgi:hypothetical protein
MTPGNNLATAQPPSKGAIVKATFIALAVALVLLFTAILPAEYGIDPLRTGALLHLTGIAKAGDTGAGARATPAQHGVVTPQSGTYKIDSEDMGLHPGEGVEVKYHMQKGATMVYSWKANGKLQFEFHGEPDKKPKADYFESYELNDKGGVDQAYGTFTAPTTGVHGWFWQNKGTQDVRFHVNVAGFFDAAKMYDAGAPPEDLIISDPPKEANE